MTADGSTFGERSLLKDRQRVIIEAARDLLTISEPEALVEALFEKLSSALQVDVYFNFILPPGSDRMVLKGCSGAPPEVMEELRELELGVAVCGTVALRREGMVVEGVQQRDDEMTEFIRDLGIRAYACFPLMTDGELIGTLSFGRRDRDGFEEDELELAEALANLVAVAFHRQLRELERNELLERESELRETAEQANRMKDRFLAIVSHELRTPMTTALGWAQLLLAMDETTEDQRQAAEQIERSLQRQRRLVQDLIEISKLREGRIEIRTEKAPIFEVVRRAAETFRPAFEDRGVSLEIESGADGGPSIPIDSQRIEQVVTNLIGNALKFTPAGGEVRLRLFATDDEARIEVKDCGPGIPADLIPKIFDPFVQGRDRRASGMGLGLAIARGLVERHGGTIRVESDGAGSGSTFMFTLPIRSDSVDENR